MPSFIEIDGERLTVNGCARKYGMSHRALRYRLKAGWSLARAISEPARISRRELPAVVNSKSVDRIPHTRGKVAIIDPEDHALVSDYLWYAFKGGHTFYAQTNTEDGGTEFMHRIILKAPKGKDVDHIDGDGLNNRKANLRLVNDSENQQNRLRWSLNRSGYRGVSWSKPSRKWYAKIKRHGKTYYLGLHATKENAARAYDAKATEVYGPQARLNFPVKTTRES